MLHPGSLVHADEGTHYLIVAHRISTIHNADRIVVLKHGHIAEIGTHVEFINRDRVYSHLQMQKSKKFQHAIAE